MNASKKLNCIFFRSFFQSGYVPYNPYERTEGDLLRHTYTNMFWLHRDAKKPVGLTKLQHAWRQWHGKNVTDYFL